MSEMKTLVNFLSWISVNRLSNNQALVPGYCMQNDKIWKMGKKAWSASIKFRLGQIV